MIIDDGLCWDVYYLMDSPKLYCMRIFNVKPSFLVARIPGMSCDQFIRYIDHVKGPLETLANKFHTRIRTDLADGGYFNFGHNREYLEIFSGDPRKLDELHKALNKSLTSYYVRIRVDKLSPEDQLFYRNTETPFRYTSTTTSITSSVYYLSTRFNVPLIGGARVDMRKLTDKYPNEYEPQLIPGHVRGLNAQKSSRWWSDYDSVNENISAITKDDTVDFKHLMRMFSYDIETYNPDGILDSTLKECPIIAIGIGMFNLTDSTPLRRYCITSKPFDEDPKSVVTGEPLEFVRGKHYGYPSITVKGEYIIGSSKHINPEVINETIYIITRNEECILKAFMNILEEETPQIITGFNTFGFDDKYVYNRMRMYSLDDQFIQLFTYYSLDVDETDLPKQRWFKPFIPAFKKFELKIDGEPFRNNETVRAWLVMNVDVYKLMLKEDPKRFTQHGRGNLDTMLEVYDVKNPFNDGPLSKSGMKIQTMFDLWRDSKCIYDIALYCAQDSWITGTLLINRAKLSDLIEMSGISNTQFADSLYRADGVRVAQSILNYGYTEKFALMDTSFKFRHEMEKGDESVVQLGGKTYDKRTIVGGAVRNIHAGRQWFVVALDYASMYPANKEASNVDTSSRVDDDIIGHPEKYGIDIIETVQVNDMYGKREIYYIDA